MLGQIPLNLSEVTDVGDIRGFTLKHDVNEKGMDGVNPYLIEKIF